MTEKLYSNILVPLDNSPTDETIINHVRKLAACFSAKVTLIHVADGFMARNQERLIESPEMESDTHYLGNRRRELMESGLNVEAVLVCGEPANEILAYAHKANCDLIAMATHGHRGLSDLILGSVASNIRHRTHIPVLMVKSQLTA
jgi:nucleotide-binding universal stress UspA family protein